MGLTDREKLEQLARGLSALRAVAAACGEETDEDRLVERVTETVCRVCGLSGFGVFLLREETGELLAHPSYRSRDGGRMPAFRLGEGVVGAVASAGEPMRVPYVKKEPLYREVDPETRSKLCVPLEAGGRILGVLDTESPSVSAYTEADEDLLAALAGLLAPALARLRTPRAPDRATGDEQRYRGIFDNALEGIFQASIFGEFLSVNPAMAFILGYSSTEEIMADIKDIGIEVCAEPDVCPVFLERVMTEGVVQGFEARFLRRDGTSFWGSMSARALTDAEGKVTSLEGFLVDIGDRKRMEAALRDSGRRRAAVLDGSPIPQFFIGMDHVVLDWNRALEEATGVRAEEVLGTDRHWSAFYRERQPCLADLVADGNAEEIQRQFGEKENKVAGNAYNATGYFPDLHGGGGRWLSVTAVAIEQPAGETVGVLETIEDITERKMAEAALRESETRFRTLAETTAVGIVITESGRITYANPAAERLTGLPRESLLQARLLDLVHPDDRKRVNEQAEACFEGRPPAGDHAVRVLHASGALRWVLGSVGLMRLERGPALVTTFYDVTERKHR
jgi:PAS domain S-box-containing protein